MGLPVVSREPVEGRELGVVAEVADERLFAGVDSNVDLRTDCQMDQNMNPLKSKPERFFVEGGGLAQR